MLDLSVTISNKNSIDLLKLTAERNTSFYLSHTSTQFKANINPYLLYPCLATQTKHMHYNRQGEEGEK